MKLNKCCCVIFGCLMVVLMAASLAEGGQTFLSNAGFELNTWGAGFADEWGVAPAGTVDYHNTEPNKAHSGSAFIIMTPGPDGWAVCWSAVDIPVARDTNYSIAAFIADANGGQSGQYPSGAAQFKLEWYANRGDPFESRLDTDYFYLALPKDGNYYPFSGQARNNSDANYVRIVLVVAQVGGQTPVFKFDDVTFERTSPLASPEFNGDRTVNFVDFAQFAKGYKKNLAVYDMDGDGSFGISDLALFTREWTRTIPDIPGYQFVWSDEFDGVEIDYSKWTHEVGDSWYNNEIQSYTARPDNSVVENGNLVIQ
jgi:hypothetical protein